MSVQLGLQSFNASVNNGLFTFSGTATGTDPTIITVWDPNGVYINACVKYPGSNAWGFLWQGPTPHVTGQYKAQASDCTGATTDFLLTPVA